MGVKNWGYRGKASALGAENIVKIGPQSGPGDVSDAAKVGAAMGAVYGPALREFLLGLARQALGDAVAGEEALPPLDPPGLSPSLLEKKACFVTLTRGGVLRGCIGHLSPQEPLYRAVALNVRNAALRDPRFPAVQPDELNEIRIEISVLSEPRPLSFSSPEELLAKLRVKLDGVLLRVGYRMATFLPQVWMQVPDKVEFLNQLAEKAGCPSGAWRGSDSSISTYTVESFGES